MSHIPFNRAALAGGELSHIQCALEGMHISGCGQFTAKSEQSLSLAMGGKFLLVTSCTHALEMAAILLGIGPGDEVIVPAFTFVSTANAFVLRGVRPVGAWGALSSVALADWSAGIVRSDMCCSCRAGGHELPATYEVSHAR
jgi:dTDP-4-amino-4,6-dideoxygalactose transaminase